MQSKEIVRWVKRIEQFMSEAWSAEEGGRVVFDWLFLILGGLRAARSHCSAQKRKQTNQSNSARLLLLFSPFDWTKRKSNWEKRRREGRASQTTNKRKREAALKLFLLVGYGRWPSCSAPIPLIFSFPIQRLISCCSPHASLLPLFFGAQPKRRKEGWWELRENCK